MTTFFDITIPLNNDTPVWPGDKGIRIWRTAEIGQTSDFNISRMELGVHSGTHIDAPFHLFSDGKTIDAYALDQLIGSVLVVEIQPGIELITKEILENINFEGFERVLFKTDNSKYWNSDKPKFTDKYIALSSSGANYLATLGLCLVGIDYFSVSPMEDLLEPHRILLRKGITVLENVDLREVQPGVYTLYCLPMKLTGTDGAPVRAILQL